MLKGFTYVQAVQKLFELAGIKYSFGEHGVQTKRSYYYPVDIVSENKGKVYGYLAKRKISKETVDYAKLDQDKNGNVVLKYYDLNDVLTMIKLRPSRKVNKGEAKNWCLKDENDKPYDTAPLLFNMNRINVGQPLLICCGEIDCLSAIESGFHNAVSIPLGDGNTHWIEENWDWLEEFKDIIICADNDESGRKFQKDIVYRLGSWRCKIVNVPETFTADDGKETHVKDLNEVLFWYGKEKVLEIILNAHDTPVESVVDYSDIKEVDLDEIDGLYTGIHEFDTEMMRLFYGTFNILTGINGCVDGNTEYFNGKEWHKISEYSEGDMVLQYDESGAAVLVYPESYHKYPCDHFWHFKSNYGVDQCVSDEHNLVYLTSKGNVQKKNALEWIDTHSKSKNGFQGKFITTFNYNGDGISLTDEQIRVMCAVICDGSFINGGKLCRVNIKKERKQERLRNLLGAANIPYEVKKFNPRDPLYETFHFDAPLRTKIFGSYWYGCSQHQLQVIADEVLHWDGHVTSNRRSFSTCIKESADFVQFVFSACGNRATVSVLDRRGQHRGKYIRHSLEYTVIVSDSIQPSLLNVKDKTKIPIVESPDGYKYCFTVPSGMLVLRRNGKINITGNSGKSSFISQLVCQCIEQGRDAWLYSKELPNYMTKNWINYIWAGNRHIKKYVSNKGAVYYKVTNEAKNALDAAYKNRLYIYKDGWPNTIEHIKTSMEDSARKFGCKLFVLDNLTAINLECGDDAKWSKQVDFINYLIEFAKKYFVTVILVIHPKKIETMRRLQKMDVAGLGSLVDLAHRLISLYRVTPKDKAGERRQNGKGFVKEPIKYDVLLDVLKDRMRGRENLAIGLYYDVPSRRFFTNPEEYEFNYGWDQTQYADHLEYPIKDNECEVFGN